MNPQLLHGPRFGAVYMHWPSFNVELYTNSLVHNALKRQLNWYLYANCLHLNGPIYFGREVPTRWPEDVVLDILGIIKRRAKSLNLSVSQQISLEIDVKDIDRYDYRRLCASGVNRYNIVADCRTDNVIELMEAGFQHLKFVDCLKQVVAVELLYADRKTVSLIVRKACQFAITHVTIWPRVNVYSELYNVLTAGAFVAYERYHYGYGGHYSAYMEHMWNQKNIVGIGPGAESMIDNKRYKNAACMRAYLQQIDVPHQVEASILCDHQLLNEYIILNVGRRSGALLHRCAALVDKKKFKALCARIDYLKAKDIVWCSKEAFGISMVPESVYHAAIEDLIVL